MVSFASAQQSSTVWTIGLHYNLTYAEDMDIQVGTFNQSLSNFPISFNITKLNNTGYDYMLIGDLSRQVHSVQLQIIQVPNFGTFELPSGDLPIVLPISFNGKEDWMDAFGESLQTISNVIAFSNYSSIFTANITLSPDTIKFSFKSFLESFSFDNKSFENILTFMSFLPEQLFELGIEFINSSFNALFSFSKTSGILQDIQIEFSADAGLDASNNTVESPKLFQKLTFAVVVPKIDSSGLLGVNGGMFPMTIFSLMIVYTVRRLGKQVS